MFINSFLSSSFRFFLWTKFSMWETTMLEWLFYTSGTLSIFLQGSVKVWVWGFVSILRRFSFCLVCTLLRSNFYLLIFLECWTVSKIDWFGIKPKFRLSALGIDLRMGVRYSWVVWLFISLIRISVLFLLDVCSENNFKCDFYCAFDYLDSDSLLESIFLSIRVSPFIECGLSPILEHI